MEFINPKTATTPIEIKTSQAVDRIRVALGDFESVEDIDAMNNALVTILAHHVSVCSRNDIDVLDSADQIKSAIISYHVHTTKE